MFKEVITGMLLAILFCVLPACLIWWEVYKYQDCKKVGHATMYCIFAKN